MSTSSPPIAGPASAPSRPARSRALRSRALPSGARLSRALSLEEREVPPGGPSRDAAAQERAEEWLAASGLPEATFDAHRLASAELDRHDFLRLLHQATAGTSPVARSERPDALIWLDVLDDIERGTAAGTDLPSAQWTMPDGSPTTEPPFASFIRPFLEVGFHRLRADLLQDLAPAVELKLYLDLVERLVKRCSSTLILELNVARLEGRLRGETSAERFRYFAEKMFTPGAVLDLLDEYPVLARSLATAVRQWCGAMAELLERLRADRELLAPLVESDAGSEPFGLLADLDLGISDPHRGGRGVAVLVDDQGRRVVYKPTSLAADRRLHALLEALGDAGLRHQLRAVDAIDCGDYGWQAYVATLPCASAEELQRFYWRQGALIAVLHMVRGADVHHENLIAHGEHPILVDNEALFQHPRPLPAATAGRRAVATMGRSVLRQALLPFVHRLTASGDGVDSSGLGGSGGQVAPGSVRRWADPGRDTMRVEAADYVSREAGNRPRLGEEAVDASHFVGDILRGFRETYDLISSRRDALRPVLEGFADAPVRYLARPTRIYSVFLREARHPNDLRDGLDRDQLLDRLWALSEAWPALRRVVAHEHRDLWQGDVPSFSTRPDSVDLWSSRGERIEGFFAESSLDEARRLLDAMSPEDRERQALLVRLSLDEATARAHGEPAPPAVSSEADLLDAVQHVVRLLRQRLVLEPVLESSAVDPVPGKDCAFWIGLDPFVGDTPGSDKQRNIALAGSDLYHGAAGIALALATVAHATGDHALDGLARATLAAMDETRTATDPMRLPVLGAFVGRGAYAYTSLHLATLWREPSLLDSARADLAVVEELIAADEDYDVLTGCAGFIPMALALHARTGDGRALEVACRCGDALLAAARPVDGGVGWIGRSFDGPVVGFAHGQAGIAWSLLELAAATDDERYRDAALAAIDAERVLLAAVDGESFRRRISWCHGLPSVAVGRLLSLRHLDEPSARGLAEAEIRAGAEAILAAGPPADSCLCHGVLGNAEILDLAGRALGVESWRRTAHSWALLAARRATELGREGSPLPLHGRFAGLLTGLAGLAWGLLRFARPDAVPSVLTLEMPNDVA